MKIKFYDKFHLDSPQIVRLGTTNKQRWCIECHSSHVREVRDAFLEASLKRFQIYSPSKVAVFGFREVRDKEIS